MKSKQSKNDQSHALQNKNQFSKCRVVQLTPVYTIKLPNDEIQSLGKSNPNQIINTVSISQYEIKKNQRETISSIHHVSVVSGIFLTCGVSIFICLIPQHDILEEPYYWYESMFLGAFVWPSIYSACVIIGLTITGFTNAKNAKIKNLISYFILSGIGAGTCIFLCTSYYCIWKYALQLFPPLPFNAFGCAAISTYLMHTAIWYRMPKKARIDPSFKKRFAYYMISVIVSQAFTFGYGFLTTAFKEIPSEFQWTLVIVCILYRQSNTWIRLKLSYKAAGAGSCDLNILKLCVINNSLTEYVLFVTILIGSVATTETTYAVIFVDFSFNIYSALKIVYLMKYCKKENSNVEAQEELDILVLTERMEAIMPVTYALIFIMAYYGPNAEIIGNVKFTQWHFNAITDLEEYLSKIALYFIVDLSSAMISGVILWTTCKINIFKMIQKIQKDLWYFIAIYDTYTIVTYFFQACVGLGQDFTLEFNWRHGESELNNTSQNCSATASAQQCQFN